MAQIKYRIQPQTRSWSADLRPKVTDTVSYNGFYWSNITGINGEPGIGADWLKAALIELESGLIKWNDYRVYKKTGNTLEYPQPGDEVHGRGNGTLENGENVRLEAINPMPDIALVSETDYNFLTSYP